MTPNVNILLVDDHEMFLQGMEAIFAYGASEYTITTARSAADARTLLSLYSPPPYNIILLDINMPDTSGIDFCKEIRAAYPALRIIGLSMHCEPHFIRAMIQAGASGYVIKSSGKQELISAVRNVLSGASYISPVAAMALAVETEKESLAADTERRPFDALSGREKEIVKLIATGLSSKEIAHRLFISVSTVETHRKSILRKTRSHNTADLVSFAIRNGLA